MKQVVQKLRTGEILVEDVPVPLLEDSFVLVRNRASVISAGTEKTKVDMGKKSLLQKARARPDLVKQVIKKLHSDGLKKTLQTVNTRLDAPSPLGYSCSGQVMAVGGMVEGIQPGDRVACAGAGYANHAEVVAVPKNLVVKIPGNVHDDDAAFCTIGAIALQGVRLADPKIGETFLVLGLGLIGQITVQILRANGCRVLALDLDPTLVSRAEDAYQAVGIKPGGDAARVVSGLTGGVGVDGVLICAGTQSNQPIELAGEVTREKGRVVVVGAVKMDIPREEYFRKEISVVISRSYGPGRYDPVYEEKGHDYPLGYVRFTEKRNMESFLRLLSEGSVEVGSLITHRFAFDEADHAYELIEGERKEPYLGILLNYGNEPTVTERVNISSQARIASGDIRLSFLGAGNYATATLIPALSRLSNVKFSGIATNSGRTAQGVASKFDFDFCTSDFFDLLKADTSALVIAARHNAHAENVVRAFEAGKHVYVEKPLALSVGELAAVHSAYRKAEDCCLMVGFNRRFAPLTIALREHFSEVSSPLSVNIRVNAGSIPSDHWIQDPEIGGGRILGEACHFIDLASHIIGEVPTRVYANFVAAPEKALLVNDNATIQLSFADGSIASILYVADGSPAMEKEHIEVFGGGRSAAIHDFRCLELYTGSSLCKSVKLKKVDKGQQGMLEKWIESLRTGSPCIDYESLLSSSLATVLAVESGAVAMPLGIDLKILERGSQDAV